MPTGKKTLYVDMDGVLVDFESGIARLDAAARKRLILSHHKDLCRGDFLVDDRTRHGADRFAGEHVHFGSSAFPDWATVTAYLLART